MSPILLERGTEVGERSLLAYPFWGNEGATMLWTLIVILLVFWLLGQAVSFGGGLIHLLLVVALVLFIVNLLGRSGRVG